MSEAILALNLRLAGFHRASWRRSSRAPAEFLTLDHALDVVGRAAGYGFDSLFLADTPVLRDDDPWGALTTALEPLSLLASVATRVPEIGLIGTVSSTYDDPYTIARRLATLDHLSGGRAGLNVVVSAPDPRTAANFGRVPLEPRQRRYERADEFLDVVARLWRSWEDDAIVDDRDGGVLVDPARIHPIRFQGAHFRVEGPLNVPRPPQPAPVFVQAGASANGIGHAARWADLVYSAKQPGIDASGFREAIRTAAAAAGRTDGGPAVLSGLLVHLGRDDAEAAERRRALDAANNAGDVGLDRLSQILGTSLDGYDPGDLVARLRLQPPEQGGDTASYAAHLLAEAERDGLTVAELAARAYDGLSAGQWRLQGGPDAVAQALEARLLADEADGFSVLLPDYDETLDLFGTEVLPRLRDRGIHSEAPAGLTLRERLALRRSARGDRSRSSGLLADE